MADEGRLKECPVCGTIAAPAWGSAHMHARQMVAFEERTAPLAPEPIEALEAELERLEPWLRKTDWYPMTYMLIPSVLAAAELLPYRLAACAEGDRARAEACQRSPKSADI